MKEVRRMVEDGRKSKRSKRSDKKPKEEQEEDDDFLDDLVVEKDTDKRGLVTKGVDRKTRLDQRQGRIAAVTGIPDDGQEEEMEQERLE